MGAHLSAEAELHLRSRESRYLELARSQPRPGGWREAVRHCFSMSKLRGRLTVWVKTYDDGTLTPLRISRENSVEDLKVMAGVKEDSTLIFGTQQLDDARFVRNYAIPDGTVLEAWPAIHHTGGGALRRSAKSWPMMTREERIKAIPLLILPEKKPEVQRRKSEPVKVKVLTVTDEISAVPESKKPLLDLDIPANGTDSKWCAESESDSDDSTRDTSRSGHLEQILAQSPNISRMCSRELSQGMDTPPQMHAAQRYIRA